MRRTTITIHKLLAAALLLTPLAGQSQELATGAREQIKALLDEKEARTPAQRKLDSQLVYLTKQSRNQPIAKGLTNFRASVLTETDNRVLVDISATVSKDLLDAIAKGGGEVVNQFAAFNAIRARLPIGLLETLAARADVRSIGPAAEAATRIGSTLSEGDRTHKARLARTNLGVTGHGVKIGVLSDGVNSLGVSKNNGNLNASATFLPGQAGSGDEGTAMMELIQDLAPGAELIFATAQGSPSSFATNILALQAAGCSVIVDDVGYFNESPFQDQVIAQAVSTVSSAGVLYFSSAGNSGNKNDGTSGTWEGDFVNGGSLTAPLTGTGQVLNFGGGTNYNIVAADGSDRRADLFWADPDLGSNNDYDLFILDSAGTSVVRSSTNVQTGLQSPYESVNALAAGERIVVVKRSGAADRFLHLDTGGAVLTLSTGGNVRGHSASGAANAFSVAATAVANSASPNAFTGGGTNPVETFSSDGPRRIFFDAGGVPLTPGNFSSTGGSVLNKPDITAADGAQTSVPGFTTFFGTSAAAPHAAAIAALVKSYRPTLTPAQIRTALTSTALDIEAVGWDRDSGTGIIMAEPALSSLTAPDALRVAASGDFGASGPAGGSFGATSVTYTLTNTSGASLNWSAFKTQPWITLSSSSGTLAASANTSVTASLNTTAAASLPGGSFADTITIANVTTGYARNLAVNLVATVAVPASGTRYSNLQNLNGTYAAGGTTTTSVGTKVAADDLTLTSGSAGAHVSSITFTIANQSGSSINARAGLRFWDASGTSGRPGSLLASFGFPPVTFLPGTDEFTFQPSLGQLIVPAGSKIWAGLQFDGVGTSSTVADLNSLGQGVVNSPTVGSSADTIFITSSAGGNAINNPSGGTGNFGGSPAANFGWAIVVSNLPSVTTDLPTAVSSSGARLGGNVVSESGVAVTERGIVWGLSVNPTTSSNKVINGSGAGKFSASVSGIPAYTTVHVRAYAINAHGTVYGSNVSFKTLDTLATARVNHTATLLANGKVLVAGGSNSSGRLNSAELFDPATGDWTTTGSMAYARTSHTATLLADGKVLVAGSYDSSSAAARSSAEVYNPATGTWTTTGSLITGRTFHTATLLPSGKVLVTGGYDGINVTSWNSVELYDPTTGVWSAASSFSSVPRFSHTATLLPNGRVLVAGGFYYDGPSDLFATLNVAEIYNPATNTWTTSGNLLEHRYDHTATLLADGKVLIAGGTENYTTGVYIGLATSEVFDPATGIWTGSGSLLDPREFHKANLLLNGKVLVIGGKDNSTGTAAGLDLYDPITRSWTNHGGLGTDRTNHTSTTLPSGKVLIVGGVGLGWPASYLNSAEVYEAP